MNYYDIFEAQEDGSRLYARKSRDIFDDMCLRVRNIAPCEIRFADKKPEHWLYRRLLFTKACEGFHATVGDLTIRVSSVEAIVLILLATKT